VNLKEIEWRDMDWIYLTPDRDNWRSFSDTVFYKILRKVSVTERLATCQEGLISMEIVKPEVMYFLLNYFQLNPPNESTLRKNFSTQVL
jgi:hypothetical protein